MAPPRVLSAQTDCRRPPGRLAWLYGAVDQPRQRWVLGNIDEQDVCGWTTLPALPALTGDRLSLDCPHRQIAFLDAHRLFALDMRSPPFAIDPMPHALFWSSRLRADPASIWLRALVAKALREVITASEAMHSV